MSHPFDVPHGHIKSMVAEWEKTLNYEQVKRDGIRVTLPQAEVCYVLGWIAGMIDNDMKKSELIKEQERTVHDLQVMMMCDVCLGQPLASGKRCMCGGTGYKHIGVDYLREQLFKAELALEAYDVVRNDLQRVTCELQRIERDRRQYEKPNPAQDNAGQTTEGTAPTT